MKRLALLFVFCGMLMTAMADWTYGTAYFQGADRPQRRRRDMGRNWQYLCGLSQELQWSTDALHV